MDFFSFLGDNESKTDDKKEVETADKTGLHSDNGLSKGITESSSTKEDISEHTREDNCNELPFSHVAKMLNDIAAASGEDKFKPIFDKKLKAKLKGQSMFPLIRLLFPLQDTRKYGIKAAKISDIYIEIFHLNKDVGDGLSLHKWNNQALADKNFTGDFGSTIEKVLQKRAPAKATSKTIGDVNAILDKLSAKLGDKERKEIFEKEVRDHFNANEQKWIIRIIMQDPKVGLNHETFLKRLVPNMYALNRFNTSLQLKEVLDEVTNPKFVLPNAKKLDRDGEDVRAGGGGGLLDDNASFHREPDVSLKVFSPFYPMLAKGFMKGGGNQVADAEGAMRNHAFDIEIKYDGERHMVHYSGRKSMMFTRNGVDYTDRYFPLLGTVSRLCRKSGVGSAILDGEVVSYSKDLDDYVPFGENRTIAKMEFEKAIDQTWNRDDDDVDKSIYGPPPNFKLRDGDWRESLEYWLKYVVFDIVYLDDNYGIPGTCERIIESAAREVEIEFDMKCPHPLPKQGSIVHLPLVLRKRILSKVLYEEMANVVEMIGYHRVTIKDSKLRQDAIIEEFNKANMASKEGLVVKDLMSPYYLGARKDIWVKMKPEYSDENNDYDCIVLGLRYAEGLGFRRGKLCSMLLGVKEVDDNGAFKRYVTFCSVGSGINMEELRAMNKYCEGRAVTIKDQDSDVPDFLRPMWKQLKADDRPHVYIHPENSFVVQIKGSELCPSQHFQTSITLRFPRLIHFRFDKNVQDIITHKELLDRKNKPRIKTYEEMQEQSRKLRATKKTGNSSSKRLGPQVDPNFKPLTHEVENHGNLFAKHYICVMDGEARRSNGEIVTHHVLQTRLKEQGANLCISYDDDVRLHLSPDEKFLVVVIDQNYRSTMCINHALTHDSYDVIRYEYICDCLDQQKLLDLKPHYYLAMSGKTQEMFRGKMDVFNLNYEDSVDLERFVTSFDDSINLLKRQMEVERNATELQLKKRKKIKTMSASIDSNGEMENHGRRNGIDDEMGHADSERIIQRREAVAYYESIKSKGLRDIALTFNVDERDALVCPQLAAFSVHDVIYVDIFADVGDIELPSSDSQSARSRNASIIVSNPHRPLCCPNPPLRTLALQLEMYGAQLASCLHAGVTHIIVSPDDLERKAMIRARITELLRYPGFQKRVCTPLWAQNIIKEGCFRAPTLPGELIDSNLWSS